MHRKTKTIIIFVLSLCVIGAAFFALRNAHFAVLDPKGVISEKEKSLMLFAIGIMSLVAVPVFGFLLLIILKNRKGNMSVESAPEKELDVRFQLLWWIIPSIVILVLGIVNWRTTHELDPMGPLVSTTPITIQVVSLQWKWLFIYPDQHIATVNFVEFPEKTPVNFVLTSDAPMNSFWIPQLGGQMYSMAGMSTNLHLEADGTGDYNGRAAEISGPGFAGMTFIARSVSVADFAAWTDSLKRYSPALTTAEYQRLAQPSSNVSPAQYGTIADGLYNAVIMKYMSPENIGESGANTDANNHETMQGMNMR